MSTFGGGALFGDLRARGGGDDDVRVCVGCLWVLSVKQNEERKKERKKGPSSVCI